MNSTQLHSHLVLLQEFLIIFWLATLATEHVFSKHKISSDDQVHIDNNGLLATFHLGLELVHVHNLLVTLIPSHHHP